jgi:uncharacterized protein YbaP (TraB family)
MKDRLAKALATLLAAALLAPAFASTAVAQAPAGEPPAARVETKDAPRRGLLYEIKSGANTAYLFGTLHIGKPEFYPLDPPTNAALGASSRIYLEVNLSDAGALVSAMQAAVYPGTTTVADSLPSSLLDKLRARLSDYPISPASVLKMKPWMIAHTLLLLEAKRHGYAPELASELYLLSYAASEHKEILGLETLADQFAIFDRLSPSEQQVFLEQTLAELDDSAFESRLKALIDAWANGDAAALERALRAERERASIYADTLLPRLIDQRNLAMAEKIEKIVRAGSQTFFAVGAFHLVGKDGIVELLRRRGLAVRQL